jgi:hypothetical protein
LAKENERLNGALEDCKNELEDGEKKFQKAIEDIEKYRKLTSQSDLQNDILTKENEELRIQIAKISSTQPLKKQELDINYVNSLEMQLKKRSVCI